MSRTVSVENYEANKSYNIQFVPTPSQLILRGSGSTPLVQASLLLPQGSVLGVSMITRLTGSHCQRPVRFWSHLCNWGRFPLMFLYSMKRLQLLQSAGEGNFVKRRKCTPPHSAHRQTVKVGFTSVARAKSEVVKEDRTLILGCVRQVFGVPVWSRCRFPPFRV